MSTMQSSSRLYRALRESKQPSLGAWQMFPGAHISRTIARSGFDWVCVDTEHGNIDDAAMHDCVGAIAGSGVSPIVRVPANEGAHGVVVPLLKTAEDAMKVVDACKFPPQGSRGFGSPFPMASFGKFSQLDYLRQANDTLITIVQIETKEALQNIDSIAKVPGVDVLFVGPFDLGNSIGFPIETTMAPELKQAIAKIRQAATANKKFAGIYATSGEQAKCYIEEGFQMISVANDATSLAESMSRALVVASG